MAMRRLHTVGVAALATASVSAAIAVGVGVGSRRERSATAVAVSPHAGRARDLGPPGRRLTWPVELVARMRNAPPGGGAATGLDGTTTVTGDWVTTVSGIAAGGGTDVACELRRAHVAGAGFGDAPVAEVQRLESTLATRFWVTYQPDGAARALHFPRELPDDVRNLLALLVTETQLVRPSQEIPQWTATERDGAGAYLAAYSRSGQEIAKQRLRYVAVDGAGGQTAAAVGVQIDASEGHFTVDAAAVVRAATVHDRMSVDMKLGAPGLLVDVRLALGPVRADAAPELAGSLGRAEAAAGLDSGPVVTQRASADVLQARQDAQLIANVTLKGILADVAGGRIADRTHTQLTALLRRRPGEIPEALDYARAASEPQARIVLDALGAADTPAAQSALATLAGNGKAAPPLRTIAAGALVQTKHPTAATIAALLRLLDDPEPRVSREALFVAGAVGNQARATDPDGAAAVERVLLARLARCHGAVCSDALIAIGNLASSGALPAIERSLREPDPAVRAAAARALRKLDVPAADRLLGSTMVGDRDAAVRAAAVRATAARSIGPVAEPLARVIQADPVDYVRTDAIEAAARHVDESPAVSRALFAVAAADRSPGVQRLARSVLGPRFGGGTDAAAHRARKGPQ
jgi:hypothetical protein